MLKSLNASFALLVASVAAPALADTLVYNINGIQVGSDGRLERFGGLVIGDDGKVEQLIQRTEELNRPIEHEIDGEGRTLLPGIIDAHGHLMDMGFMAIQLDLLDTQSLSDLQKRVKDYAAANPNARWIVGRGWNQELWADKRFPTAADIDAAVADRPVVLERVDGHSIVANSAAMRLAGVTSQTASPKGGRIENGLFVDNATELLWKAVPPATASEEDLAFRKAQDTLLGYGITATVNTRTPLADWNTFRRAGDSNQLHMRIIAYGHGIATLGFAPRPTTWLFADRLRLAGIKFYTDGALGSRGAWLKRPYTDEPGTRGLQIHSDAELYDLANRSAAAGFQLAIHGIGDAANAQVISTFEKLGRVYPGDRRWRLEHAQVLDPTDIPRLAPAGIIASMQPTHQVSDRTMAEVRLGPDRLAGAYAWNSILKSGARLAFGSDYPFDRPNPFPGLAAAISRHDLNGQPPGGWQPQERVSFEQALAGFTRGAAYASFAEGKIGSLEPGKWADFILVDRDVSQVDPQSLGRTQVLETWVAGKRVWTSADEKPAR
jgi:predicted amidohydrolase YtcJ